MAVKMNSYIYPYTEQVKNLPVYLTGIGGTEYQGHIKRTSEVSWAQIMYCIAGSGCLKYDDEAIDIYPGDIFYIPKGKTHEYFPYEEKWEVRWIVFDGKNIEDLMEELDLKDPAVARTDNLSVFQKLFDKMFITLKADKVYGNYLCSGLIY
ncbi:MAG: AraC family ligand binding domain-containing protein, partial [Oscillospiraceae bacterium]|nr:AraC family ligand binding domain-containing protein [Oscillospiraceae bacterium]